MLRLVAALAFALVVPACSSGRPTPVPGPGSATTVVLVSLDGFRSDYLDRPGAVNLRAIGRAGVQARTMEPVFPTKTFPNHYTLVTGLYPEHHGIISNTMEDSAIGYRFTISDSMANADPRWWGGEPLWLTVERQGRKAATYFWPGSEAKVGGVHPTWWMKFDNTVPNAVRVRQVLEWLGLPAGQRPALITLYFSDVDHDSHEFGPDAPETDAAITRVDSAVGALWRGIGERDLQGQVNLIVVSDHGMAATSSDRVVFLDDYLTAGTYRMVDWNPVAMIVPAAGREDDVYQRLSKAPHLATYRRAEIPERYHFRASDRITPIIGIADDGYTIISRARFNASKSVGPRGMHGYDNQLPSMGALFVAAGPAFAPGRVVPRVRALDVYALVASILRLQPAPNDGSLDSIRVVLRGQGTGNQ